MSGYLYCAKCGKLLQSPHHADTTASPIRSVTTYLPDGTETVKHYCLFCNPKEGN